MTNGLLSALTFRGYVRIVILLVIVGLAVAWRWTPLSDWLSATQLLVLLQSIREMQMSPFIVTLCMIVASLLMVPLSLVVLMSGLLFGPWWGFIYALASGMISGALGYYLGVFLGRDFVHRLAGERIHKISAALGERGIVAVIGLRVVPFAPFTVQNMVAGASHIKQRDFSIGNAIGLLPSIAFVLLLVGQLDTNLQSPDLISISVLVLSVLAFLLMFFCVKRWFLKRV